MVNLLIRSIFACTNKCRTDNYVFPADQCSEIHHIQTALIRLKESDCKIKTEEYNLRDILSGYDHLIDTHLL